MGLRKDSAFMWSRCAGASFYDERHFTSTHASARYRSIARLYGAANVVADAMPGRPPDARLRRRPRAADCVAMRWGLRATGAERARRGSRTRAVGASPVPSGRPRPSLAGIVRPRRGRVLPCPRRGRAVGPAPLCPHAVAGQPLPRWQPPLLAGPPAGEPRHGGRARALGCPYSRRGCARWDAVPACRALPRQHAPTASAGDSTAHRARGHAPWLPVPRA